MAIVAGPALGFEDGHRFDFNQQVRATQNGLDACRRGQGVQALLPEEGSANFVELRVIALNVAQITSGADNVFPGGAFSIQKLRNVPVGPSRLSPEVADVNRTPVLVHAGCTRDQKYGD